MPSQPYFSTPLASAPRCLPDVGLSKLLRAAGPDAVMPAARARDSARALSGPRTTLLLGR
jgi:hypothetical protein